MTATKPYKVSRKKKEERRKKKEERNCDQCQGWHFPRSS